MSYRYLTILFCLTGHISSMYLVTNSQTSCRTSTGFYITYNQSVMP